MNDNRRRTARTATILLTLTTVAAASICNVSVYAAPRPTKPAVQYSAHDTQATSPGKFSNRGLDLLNKDRPIGGEPVPLSRPPKRFAVCVGINGYKKGCGYRALSFAGSDAVGMAQTLIKNCGFHHVLLLTDSAVPRSMRETEKVSGLRISKEVTYINILRRTKALFAQATSPDDTVVFYFAGHGDARPNAFLVPGDYSGPESLALDLGTVFQLLLNAPVQARNRLVVLDACRTAADGSAGQVMVPGFRNMLNTAGYRMNIFSACDRGQSSHEDSALRHGRFTSVLIDALRGRAFKQGEENLLVSHVYEYIDRRFQARGWSTTKSVSQRQTPRWIASTDHMFALAYRRIAKPQPLGDFEWKLLREKHQQAISLYRQNDLTKADQTYRFCLRVAMDPPDKDVATRRMQGKLLAERARVLYRLGRTVESDEFATSARKKAPNEPALSELDGYKLLERRKFVQASQAFRRAISAMGDTKQVAPHLWSQSGVALFRLNRFGEAREQFGRAATVSLELGRFSDAAVFLDRAATSSSRVSDFKAAYELLRKAQRIMHKRHMTRKTPQRADLLEHMSDLLRTMGQYQAALATAQEAFDIRRQVLGEKHVDTAVSLNQMGALYWEMADYARAMPLLQRALQIQRQQLGDRSPGTVSSRSNLAKVYAGSGKQQGAAKLLLQALQIERKMLGEDYPSIAVSLNNLALLYQSMGDYAKAEPLLQQALEIRKKALGKNHPDYVQSLNNLALLYRSMRDYAQAEPLLRQAAQISKRSLGENHLEYALSLNNLASLYRTMGDYAQAEPLLRHAAQIQKKALGENHPSYATSLNNLALLYRGMGQYAKAGLLLRHALEIKKKALGENHPDYALSLNNLASLYRTVGDYAQAEPLLRQSLSISRGMLERAALVQSERQQLAMGQMLRYQLDAYISLALRKGDIAQQTFREILLWKGATLVRQRQYRQMSNEPAVAKLFKQLQHVTMQLASLARIFPDKSKQVTGWKARIAALTAEKEKLEAELSRRSASFRKAKREITTRDVAGALPKNAVLVNVLDYSRSTPPNKPGGKIVFRRSLVASVLRPDGRVSLIDLGPTDVVSAAIETWRKTFGLSRQGVMAGRLLRKTLWDPLLPAIGNAKTVLVSPDGVLGRLPLGALPGKKPGTYLLEEYRLALIPVPRLLPALISKKGRKQVQKGLLLVGDVDYDASPGEARSPLDGRRKGWWRHALVRGGTRFQRLPGTPGEIATVEKLFREVFFNAGRDEIATLSRGTATEARFRRLAPQFYYIHLATHGFFVPLEKSPALLRQDGSTRTGLYDRRATEVRRFDPGLASGLAFAGANRKPQADRDDGILTATEIAFLPLDGVELVTLSACETGLGDLAGSEGLLGVQRAFWVAGVRSTVASYWKLNDLATRRLMERFYRNLWEKKMTRIDALREAQLWLLRNPDQLGLLRGDKGQTLKQTPPYYWAAFQLSGDWR